MITDNSSSGFVYGFCKLCNFFHKSPCNEWIKTINFDLYQWTLGLVGNLAIPFEDYEYIFSLIQCYWWNYFLLIVSRINFFISFSITWFGCIYQTTLYFIWKLTLMVFDDNVCLCLFYHWYSISYWQFFCNFLCCIVYFLNMFVAWPFLGFSNVLFKEFFILVLL